MSLMGTPVTYATSEYLHTIVYRAPGFIVRKGHYSPVVVQSTRGYRPAMDTDHLTLSLICVSLCTHPLTELGDQ